MSWAAQSTAPDPPTPCLALPPAAGAVVAAPLAAVGPAAAGERILPVSSLGVLQKRDIVKEVEVRQQAPRALPAACRRSCASVWPLHQHCRALQAAPPAPPCLFKSAAPAAAIPSFVSLQKRACEELKKVLTAADAPAAMTLLLHDAGTYDRATGTGGCNGSVVLP